MDKRKILERIAILIYISLSIIYIVWRIGFTLNPDQMVASVIFLMADIMMCFSSIVFVVSLWRQSKPIIPQKDSGQFSIDVFVTTYNEDCELLESTLQHCIRMDYPHKTWLLDDGNRAEMKSLAERLGVGYIAREKNTGAKAGNLNNAMQYTQGELIAVFDVDFRPEKNFLTRLVDYFNEEKIAVVQVPQAYYNTDSFQHQRLSRKEIYSDQDMFMHLILPARNNWNAAYWIGTNTLLRREAIESIGGFPTDNLIIVGTPDWSQGVETVARDPIIGYENLVYSLHFYAASHELLRYKAAYAVSKGLPMFVSECSPSFANGDGKLDKGKFAVWLDFLKRKEIGFVMWGLYDKEESSAMLKPGANPNGNWPVSQLTEMGVYSRWIVGGKIDPSIYVSIIGALFILGIVVVLMRKKSP